MMEIANLLLEYLRVIFTWPPLVMGSLIYFLVSQRPSIAQLRESIALLIGRIRGVSFLGGELKTEYETPPENKNEETIPPSGKGTSASSGETEPRLAKFDHEFTYFLTSSLEVNRRIISKLVDVLWSKLGFELFNSKVRTFNEKMDRIKDRINENAYQDLLGVMKESDPHLKRQDLINIYIKSKSLVDYLRGLATRR